MPKFDVNESTVLTALQEAAAIQWGLITTAQAKRIGVDRIWLSRLVDRGVIDRIRHGVYALPSSTHGPFQELQAAWLLTDRSRILDERSLSEPTVVASHASAAALHGIGDMVATQHHFSATSRRQSKDPDVKYYKRSLPPEDIVRVEGLPTTSIVRTIGDLASQSLDMDHLAQSVRDAVEIGNVSFREIANQLEKYARAYDFADGEALTEELLSLAGKHTDLATMTDKFGSLAVSEALTDVVKRIIDQTDVSRQLTKASQTIRNFSSLPMQSINWPGLRDALMVATKYAPKVEVEVIQRSLQELEHMMNSPAKFSQHEDSKKGSDNG